MSRVLPKQEKVFNYLRPLWCMIFWKCWKCHQVTIDSFVSFLQKYHLQRKPSSASCSRIYLSFAIIKSTQIQTILPLHECVQHIVTRSKSSILPIFQLV